MYFLSPSFLRKKETFDDVISGTYNEILKLSKKNNYHDLTFCYKNKNVAEKSLISLMMNLIFLKS